MKARHTVQAARPGTARARHQAPEREVREHIIDWLREAYAMEKGLEAYLKKVTTKDQVSHLVKTAATAHLEETRRHAEVVKAMLETLGSDTSALKTGVGMMAQATKGLGTMFASDEQIKDLLDAYSMEHFEIASYTALAAAAESAGLEQVAQMCRSIIPQGEQMAQRLLENLPSEVQAYLASTD
ncbi:MAG TPA: DUF892 family protein [Candidatus Sulfotelmatobacter sp.]|nr:DUF892 family protein [Candidatus Sulfotelmatobacter sp.]